MSHPIVTIDKKDPRLDPYLQLTNRQLRNYYEVGAGIFIAESEIALRVAIDEGLEVVSVLLGANRVEALGDLIDTLDKGVEVFVLDDEDMRSVVGYSVTRGVLAAVRRPEEKRVADILKSARRVAVLEGLVDASNVGAIFRSAAALGVDGIFLSPTCADPWTRRAFRTSMGTVAQIPFAKAEGRWPECLMGELKDEGFYSLALALDERAVTIDDPSLLEHDKLAYFFGCEGYGLDPKTLDALDASVIIPMHHGVDSLNVSIAAALTFWELRVRE